MDPTFVIFALGAVALLWFMSSRTRKQQQKAASFRDSLTEGQEVMTGSGLFGTVVEVEADAVLLEVAPGVTTRWLKPAILKLVDPPLEDLDDEYDDDEDYDDDEYDDDEYDDDEYDEELDDTDGDDEALEDTPGAPDDASGLKTPDEDKPRS